MSHARILAAFVLVAAGFAVLAALLLPNPPARAGAAAPIATVAQSDPFLAALAPGADLTPGQAEALLHAADRVCEGVTAEVPVVVMADALAADLTLTDEEARLFVNTAATVHCHAA